MFRKKWLIRFGVGTALLALAGVAAIVIRWESMRRAGQRHLDEVAARLDAEDPDWRLPDLIATRDRRLPPDGENSAAVVAAAAKAAVPKSFDQWTISIEWLCHPVTNHLPGENKVAAAATARISAEPALVIARKLRDMPRGGFKFVAREPDPHGSLLPGAEPVRRVIAYFSAEAIGQASVGQTDAVLATAHAILNTGRSIGDEPTPISQFVRATGVTLSVLWVRQALAWGSPVDETELAALQAAFADEAAEPRLAYMFRGERAMAYRFLENMANGTLPLSDEPNTAVIWADYYELLVARRDVPGNQAALLDMMTARLKAAQMAPGPARDAAVAAADFPQTPGVRIPRDQLLAALMMMSAYKYVEAADRTRAQLITAVVALACERVRLRTGRWPAALAAIPKDILPAVPVDPFTGGPLGYAVRPDGVTVYATGADRIDDGGTNLDPSGTPGTDVGFRLWNADQRGLPPLEEAPEPREIPEP